MEENTNQTHLRITPIEWWCKCISPTTTGCVQVIPWPHCEGTCTSIPTTDSASAEYYSENVGPGQGHKQSKHPRSYNIVTAQGTAYRRNRWHLRDTQVVWKEQSSNDGINDDLEDDRAAAHPDAIPQPESPVAASHTQRVEARRSSRVSKPPNRLDLWWIQSTGH